MKNTLIIFLILVTTVSFAQNTIKGKVTNDNNIPLPKVNIIVEGTARGAETNELGLFEIDNVKPGNYTLLFSMIGYRSKRVNVSLSNQDKTLSKIILKQQDKELDEVLVDGKRNKTRVPSSSLRLKTTIQKTPQNIQIVSDEVLEDQMITNMLDAPFKNVSGVSNIEHWGNSARINMRGFRLPAFRNGINIQDKWGPLSEDMFMVDKIEFAKGPSGFMMAAGEPGGFYNVVTKKPTLKKIAKISLMAGTQDTYRGALDLGGKIGNSERFLFRFNTMYQTRGSHRKFEQSNRFGIAPSISYQITSKTKLLTEFSLQNADSYIGSAYVFGPVSKGYASVGRNFTMIDKNYPKTKIKELSLLNRLTHNFNELWSIDLQHAIMNYDQKGYSTWISKFENNGNATRYLSRWDAISEGNYFQAYINGKFNTGSLKHKILFGYDFTNKHYWAYDFYNKKIIDKVKPFNIFSPHYGDFNFPTFTRGKGSIKNIKGVYNYASEIHSAYIQNELSFLEDKIRLTLAGRYTSLLDQPFNEKEPIEYHKFTPRIGVSADIMKNLTIYGLYDQSFLPSKKPNVIQIKPGVKFNPIEGSIYEGGLKSKLFNNKLSASLSVYNITKNNLPLSSKEEVIDSKTGKGTGKFYVYPDSKVTSRGFEIDIQGKITSELGLILNYANTNVENSEKKRLAGNAKHINNAWLTYNFGETSRLKGFGLSLGYQYQVDRSSWAWGADNKTDLPNYFRMDGAINWKNNKWRVGLNINNILNEYLYSGANYSRYLYWQSEPGINGRLSVSYNL